MFGRRSLTVVCTLVGLAVAPTVHALQIEALHDMRTVSIGDLSTDGRWLLYSVHVYDREEDRTLTTTYLRDLDSGDPSVFFGPDDGARGPVWRPDGRAIAYVKDGEDGAHIWLAGKDGSDHRQLSADPHGYHDLAWSPDGTAIAYLATATVPPAAEQENGGSRTLTLEVPADQVTVADFIGYRHLGDGYRGDQLAQLFVLDVASGQRRRIVDAPHDVRSFAWSPAGDWLVFEAKRKEDLGINLNSDLWLVSREGAELQQLTSNPGPDLSPRWLPSGRIAYLRHTDPLSEAAARRIAFVTPERGDLDEPSLLATRFDNLIWRLIADGEDLYFTAFVRGCIDLFMANGDRALTPGGRDFWDVRIAGGRAVLSGADQTTPSALHVLPQVQSGELELLHDPNADWAAGAKLFTPEAFTVEIASRTIHGWYFLPEGLTAGQRVPTVLSIHGGPEWMYGGYFLPEFHVLPEHGYAVLIANPTGSTGYGMDFQQAIRGDWVGKPAEDVLGCLDWVIDQGWADPDRLAVMGGSYGGHLTAALTTRTDRFRAAAADRMTCELVSMWGTTDEKWFPEWEFLGRPWDPLARDIYYRNSPLNFVASVSTPTLISHGMRDYRCLIEQAECWFSALKVRGVPTRFLRFENEGHGIRNRSNQVYYLRELLAWFDRHVLNDE